MHKNIPVVEKGVKEWVRQGTQFLFYFFFVVVVAVIKKKQLRSRKV